MYKPKKSLGQYFLTDKNIAKKITQNLEFSKERYIIEIGPGRGILTEFLLSKTDRLILIEIDERLINFLKSKFHEIITSNTIFLNENILNVDLNIEAEKYGIDEFDVIGNIPYFITGEIFQWLFKYHELINVAVLTIQKEVALRVVANPGTKDYGILSIATRLYSEPKLMFNIPTKSFYPIPKVDSSTIKLKFRKQDADLNNAEQIIEIAKFCFNQRRKKIKNSISRYLELKNIDSMEFYNFAEKFFKSSFLDKRAEDLSVDDYRKLYEMIAMLRRNMNE